jgi:hypothetical protein
MLFEPARHEPLTNVAWNEARAREAIRRIVEDAEESLGEACTWPLHPLDVSRPEPPHKSLYLGASGVVWALAYLQRQGAAALRIDPATLIERIEREYLATPDTGMRVPSYFLGEVGILLVLWRLTGSRTAPGRLAAAIRANIPNPANEALWAAPGTMLGALHMHAWTQDASWRDLYLENVEQLWRTWERDDETGCYLWTQHLYGYVEKSLGAAHGFAGNAYALLRGAALLPDDVRQQLFERCAETVTQTAIVEDGAANWAPSSRHEDAKLLVQWCHGAPGIVTALSELPAGYSEPFDALLAKAGNLTWTAGPVAKGFGICHGTAGNGYAFLKLHARTGDPIWLDRARAFAMHAIEQADEMRDQHGRRRHTVWTGDPGLAVYVWHCIVEGSQLPSLDVLD